MENAITVSLELVEFRPDVAFAIESESIVSQVLAEIYELPPLHDGDDELEVESPRSDQGAVVIAYKLWHLGLIEKAA